MSSHHDPLTIAREALTKARDRFREYERHHEQKIAILGDDAADKAIRNREMADQMDAALAQLAAKVSDLNSVWHQARDNHERYSDTGSLEDDIRFLSLGLVGEAGELANFVKKRWRDGDGHDQAIQHEIADVFAYGMMLADRLGMTPESLIATIAHKQRVFVEKMAARKARP